MERQGQLFQDTLLRAEDRWPPGFSLYPDYIDRREEFELLANIDRGPWESDWRRRIQQYGLGYTADGTEPKWIRDFPEWLRSLAVRVSEDSAMARYPENCVINEYIPPLGIGPHRDYPAFGPTIACVSLGSDIMLDLIAPDRSSRVGVYLPARSLWVMTGEARSKWFHGIAPRLSDMVNGERLKRGRRVSVTFRTATDQRLLPVARDAAAT